MVRDFFASSGRTGLLSGVSFFAGITVRAVRVPVLGLFYVFVLYVDNLTQGYTGNEFSDLGSFSFFFQV